MHGLDGFRTDRRYIKPEILNWFADFYDHRLPVCQPAAATDGAVRAVNGLYRQYRSIRDNDALADIEFTDGFGHFPAQLDIRLFILSGGPLRPAAFSGQQFGKQKSRRPNIDPLFFQTLGKGPKQPIIMGILPRSGI